MRKETGVRAERRRRLRGIARTIVSVALVVGIFVYAIPKIADYSQVWTAISAMTWLELGAWRPPPPSTRPRTGGRT